jgi:hypothetical protein
MNMHMKPPVTTKVTDFQKAYAAWLAARLAAETLTHTDYDEDDLDAAMEKEMDTLWAVIRTPAQSFVDLKQRAEFVLSITMDAQMRGTPCDNRHWIALAGLVAEIREFT